MKTFYIKTGIFILGILGVSTFQIHSSSSGNSSPRTGAPNESTCTSCHTGNSLQTSGTNHGRIKLTGNFSGNGYIPDSTYRLVLSYKETGKSKFGFMVTALNKNNTSAGTFTSLNNRTGTFSSTVSGSTRYYVEHSSQGTGAVATDSAAWVFEWTAPSSNVGDINFYIALNVADNNGGTGGDVIYNKTISISPSTLLPRAKASLKSTVACTFAQNQFSASSTNNPTSYSWSFPGGTPSTSTDSTPTVQYSTTGARIAILRSFNSKGSSLNDTLSFNVLIGASAPILNTNGNILPLCEGDTASIEIMPMSNHSYTWNNGTTGLTLKTDTAGKFFAVATRTNGCKQNSREISVLALKVPKFDVSFGSNGDSACIGEPLLIFTSDKNGFTDSYSISSASGPYDTDSFITKSLSLGSNSIKVWAKNTGGCISESNTKQIFGADTLAAPAISISGKTISSVTFKWNGVRDLISYQYSTNKGKTWANPSGGKTTDSQTISITNPYDKVEFWLRANTKYYCGITKIAKITGTGTGCKDIDFKFTASDSTPCFGNKVQFLLSNILNKPNYSWTFDSTSTADTSFTITASKFKRFTASVLDSNQLACGYYSKSIDLRVNVIDTPRFDLKLSATEGCGYKQINVPVNFNNFNALDTIWIVSSKGTKRYSTTNDVTISGVNKEAYVFFYTSNENCQSGLSDEINLKLVDSMDASFSSSWINDFKYKFESSIDTNQAIHEWRINDNNGLLLSNLASFEYDFVDSPSQILNVYHSVQPKASLTFENLCVFSTTEEFKSNNLNALSFQKSKMRVYPNPIKSGQKLAISFQNKDTKIESGNLFDLTGKFVGKTEINGNSLTLPSKVKNGVYLIEIKTNSGIFKTQISLLDNEL